MCRRSFGSIILTGLLLVSACTHPTTIDPVVSTAPILPAAAPVTGNPARTIEPPKSEVKPPSPLIAAVSKGSGSWVFEIPGPNEVWLWGGEYRPSTLVVKAGTTVTWVGKDAEGHDVESDIPGLFLYCVAPGTSVNMTFNEPGVFCYHCCCGLLTGEIIVQ